MICALLLVPQASRAAIIAASGFEATGDTWTGVVVSGTPVTGGTFGISNATGSGDFPASQRILAGAQSFQINGATATADFDTINVAGYASVQVTMRISSTSLTSGNGSDAADNVKCFVALNGAAFSANPDITVSGNANARWGYDAVLGITTPAGTPVSKAAPQSGTSTNNYATLTVTVPDATTSVDLRIVATNDNTGEVWNVDSVALTGTPVPESSPLVAVFGGLAMLGGFRRVRRV